MNCKFIVDDMRIFNNKNNLSRNIFGDEVFSSEHIFIIFIPYYNYTFTSLFKPD